jgi:hypothetical protein
MRACRQIGTSLLLAALVLGLVGAAHALASPSGVRLSPREASRALHRAKSLLSAPRHKTGRQRTPKELSTTLLALARSLPSLGPTERHHAESLLSRPTDNPDPEGSAYVVPEQPPFCSTHFCVHYVASSIDAPNLTDGNGNGVPDYVEQVAAVAEASYAVENGNLGWRPPKSDGALGGDSRTDVYLVQLGGGLFGYTASDPGQRTRTQHAYLVVDDDYAPTEFPGTDPLADLEVTFAHEYNHVLQYGYDFDQDLWFYEASAVWMEDHVYPALNDYLRYIGRWVVRSKLPLTAENIKIYGSAVWNHWLAGRYGDAVVRTAWEKARSVKPAGYSIGVYDMAIRALRHTRLGRRAGVRNFAREFARFAAATAEWETPGLFPYSDAPLWQDVERRGKLRPGRFTVRRLSHTGYLLLNVRPRHVKALRLLAGAQRGTKAAFALICRQGPVATGSVRTKIRLAAHGGVRGVTLRNPGRCTRITAVLINADPREIGFAFGDWLYTHDHQRFAATVILRR